MLNLSFEVKAGLLMRQVHHWTAVVFVAVIVAHVARVFFTGAFRRPRELNWLLGFGLLVFAIAEGFTGYSLPDDLLSGTGRPDRLLGGPRRPVPRARTSPRWRSAASSRPPPSCRGSSCST